MSNRRMDVMTNAERRGYTPPPCPDCGRTDVDITWTRDRESHWVVLELRCPAGPHDPDPEPT
jgi:hypothetical protein